VAPSVIIRRENLGITRKEEELSKIAEEVLRENDSAVRAYKDGKKTALKHLLGSLMRKSKGRADPKVAESLLQKLLERKE
ncbi:MAG: Asp-tRNA(Asn)/Glu-tRNA(Gln) amidotransferase subunit GatB, partial [Planctomycetota bacterium]|nr:Asp-tRNA(Asn)/Glu-tRNA(Gln) amidotransferase subunit GatB [Planctomycetota bacterium]